MNSINFNYFLSAQCAHNVCKKSFIYLDHTRQHTMLFFYYFILTSKIASTRRYMKFNQKKKNFFTFNFMCVYNFFYIFRKTEIRNALVASTKYFKVKFPCSKSQRSSFAAPRLWKRETKERRGNERMHVKIVSFSTLPACLCCLLCTFRNCLFSLEKLTHFFSSSSSSSSFTALCLRRLRLFFFSTSLLYVCDPVVEGAHSVWCSIAVVRPMSILNHNSFISTSVAQLAEGEEKNVQTFLARSLSLSGCPSCKLWSA